MRVLWLPEVLRAAGLTVHEVPGWRDRGDDSFGPVRGITCHHTAGARTSTDAGELNVLVNGRPGLSGPIAQLYLSRTGVWHVVASGRANHNKVGWAGPNNGLGNTNLIGVEAQHSGGTEPWTQLQYRSYVRGVAAIARRLGVPAGRVGGHKEHQPGEKSDPTFNMTQFRRDVAAVLAGEKEDDVTKDEIKAAVRELLLDDNDPVAAELRARPWQYTGGGLQGAVSTLDALSDTQQLAAALTRIEEQLGRLQQPTITLTVEQVETIGRILADASGGALVDLQTRLKAAGLALAADA